MSGGPSKQQLRKIAQFIFLFFSYENQKKKKNI